MGSEVGALALKQQAELMLPPPARERKRKREPVVLEEDEWTEKIEAIIQRDYFPDLPKLESELEWLQAVKTRDPMIIRQAQANIAQRRAGLKTPLGASPATFATPGTGLRTVPRTPAMTPDPWSTPATELGARASDAEQAEAARAPPVSLDRFMAQHTSEDNASFGEVLEAMNERRRERADKLLEGPKVLQLEDARPVDGYGTSGQPFDMVLTWPYREKNALYYDSSQQAAIPYTDKELSEQVQGPPKQIRARNTRFVSEESEDPLADLPENPEDSYKPLATPSFTPGVEESPFVTWGKLEGTPLRLDESSSRGDGARGPEFKVMDSRPRDELGRKMAQYASASLQKRAAMLASPRQTMLRKTPKPGGPKTGLPMSPAAHRLASSMRGSAGAPDKQLRASYARSGLRGTPRVSESPAVTPAHATPAHASTPQLRARAQVAAASKGGSGKGEITDDLLKL